MVGKGVQLFFHSVFLVKEPPSGTPLHFTRYGPVLEIPDHGGKGFVEGGIQVVQYGFCQGVVPVEPVEEL